MASVSLISMLPAPLTDASSVATAVFRSIPVTASAVSLFAVTRPIPPMASPVAVNATLPIPAFTLAAKSMVEPFSTMFPPPLLTASATVSIPPAATSMSPPWLSRPLTSNAPVLPSVMLPTDVPAALATASEPNVTASAEVNVSALPVSVPAVWAIAPAVVVKSTLPAPAFTLAPRSNDAPVSVTLPLVALTAPFTVSAPVFVTVTLPAVEVNPVTDRPFWSNNTMLFCATPPALTRLLPVCPRVTPPLAALKLNPLPDSAPPVCVIFPVVAVNATLPIPAFTLAAKSMVEPFSTMFPPPLLTSSETVSPWLVVTSILPTWLSRPLTSNAPVLPSVMLPTDVPAALATASEPNVTASAEVNVSALPVSVPAVWAIAPAVVVKSTLPAPAFTETTSIPAPVEVSVMSSPAVPPLATSVAVI